MKEGFPYYPFLDQFFSINIHMFYFHPAYIPDSLFIIPLSLSQISPIPFSLYSCSFCQSKSQSPMLPNSIDIHTKLNGTNPVQKYVALTLARVEEKRLDLGQRLYAKNFLFYRSRNANLTATKCCQPVPSLFNSKLATKHHCESQEKFSTQNRRRIFSQHSGRN